MSGQTAPRGPGRGRRYTRTDMLLIVVGSVLALVGGCLVASAAL